ncbi:MAG: hypothetical protein OXC26_00950, partial [Albidovulum sp.]|nr:hypothetical protein [Albidovulum sp.]
MARIEAKKDALAGTDIGGRQSIEKSGFANRSKTLAQTGAAGESSVIGATFRELYLAWKVFSGCQMSGCCVAARCLMRSASLGTSGAPATP